MKRAALIFLIHAVFLPLLFCGCAASPPENAAEELVRCSWELDEESQSGSLSFEDGKIFLSIEKPDGSVLKLDDYYEADDDRIVICSEAFGVLSFEYELYGDEMELSCGGTTLKFAKSQDAQ